jgi:hypothetical protein
MATHIQGSFSYKTDNAGHIFIFYDNNWFCARLKKIDLDLAQVTLFKRKQPSTHDTRGIFITELHAQGDDIALIHAWEPILDESLDEWNLINLPTGTLVVRIGNFWVILWTNSYGVVKAGEELAQILNQKQQALRSVYAVPK